VVKSFSSLHQDFGFEEAEYKQNNLVQNLAKKIYVDTQKSIFWLENGGE